MNAPPSVSVVIPTYNRAHLLERALGSVLRQTFRDFEVLVVDDGSTDSTAGVVRDIRSPALRYIRHETNCGGSKARNSGIQAARGVYVGLLDDDDEWLPEKLQKQIDRFEAAGDDVGVVYSGYDVLSERTGSVAYSRVPRGLAFTYVDFLGTTGFGASVPLVRRACFEKVGLFDETLPGTQDRDMWLRIARRYAFAYVPDVLVRQYIHGPQLSSNLRIKIEARERILDKYALDLAAHPALRWKHLSVLGKLYCAEGRPAEGRRYLWRAIRSRPRDWESFAHVALSLVAPKVLHRRILLRYGFRNVDGIPLFY